MTALPGKTGVLVINFGEPDEPTPGKVEPFLERIFLQNAGLEASQAASERAKQLAKDRAPGLIEEYRRIGGSPLNTQAMAQAEALEAELGERGWDAKAYPAYQFTSPFVDEAVTSARADGVERLVALPVYPICGQSTTVAALEAVEAALEALEWAPAYAGVSGWHHGEAYVSMRVDNIRAFVAREGLDLSDEDTVLYFSVHGTPIKYLDEGNRYDRYVEEQCRDVALRLGADRYAVGFQNHTNRRIEWTQPDNEACIRERAERRLVVEPISFMHEQSETLAEIDHELREFIESLGKEMHRVPVPHDSERFIGFLADLVSDVVADGAEPTRLSPCRCAPLAGVRCTNGRRELPPSAYARTRRERASTGADAPTG